MIILALRTDKPLAEVDLYQDGQRLGGIAWEAHRALAETLYQKIAILLAEHGYSLADVGGIICYEGPGSFTGLRIGLAAANALAYALGVPVSGARDGEWPAAALRAHQDGAAAGPVLPFYGAEANITLPKK